MNNRILFFLVAIATILTTQAQVTDLPIKVQSPNGLLEVSASIDGDNQPVYSISRDGKTIISESKMGFEGRTSFPNGIASYDITELDETYTLPHGKRSEYRNNYRQLTVEYDAPSTQRDLTITFRVFDDAVAFRYEMKRGNVTNFVNEATEFNFTDMKQTTALSYSNDYTWYYYQRKWDELTNERGYNEPVLVQRTSDNVYILMTESANYGETAASSIIKGTKEGQLRLQTISKDAINPTSTITYPFASAWRTLIIGTPADIVESTVVLNLNPASKLTDTSWIRPGRVAWNWAGEDRKNTGSFEIAKQYADLAAYLGWEYVLIDEGWEGRFRLEDYVPYAQSKGVDVIVWYHNNKFSSDYNSCLTKFRELAAIGVKAVKIDFFDGDGQNVLKKYEVLLRAARDAKLLVDFHGCTRPTGWERTYPNLMTMEAVLGGEFLLDQPHMNQADHSANIVLGRNVIGSMDFTPTKLAQRTGSLKTHSNTGENPNTTWSYQLALWILFESGFQCLIDCPDNIIDSPIEPVLRQAPAAWDETICLEAEPAQYATLARRSGDDWYVATISKKQRSVNIPLTFLDPDKAYTAYIYRDGTASQFDISYTRRNNITSSVTIPISVRPNGGATIIITEDANRPYMRTVSYEAETVASGTSQDNVHCSGGKYKSGFTGNTRAFFRSVKADADGEYALTIYYMLPEEARRAYVQVESTGDKQYYDFHTRDDYDRSKGLVLGMKTVYVQLQKGTNRIYYGCEDGTAPDLDKITITPTRQTQEIIDGIISPEALSPSNNEQAICIEGDDIICKAIDSGTLTIFDLNGRVLQTFDVAPGETRVHVSAKGLVVASLSVNSRAFARKFYIK